MLFRSRRPASTSAMRCDVRSVREELGVDMSGTHLRMRMVRSDICAAFSPPSSAQMEWLLVVQIGEQVVAVEEIVLRLVGLALVDVVDLDPAVGVTRHHDIADVDEQPVFHHAGDLVQH